MYTPDGYLFTFNLLGNSKDLKFLQEFSVRMTLSTFCTKFDIAIRHVYFLYQRSYEGYMLMHIVIKKIINIWYSIQCVLFLTTCKIKKYKVLKVDWKNIEKIRMYPRIGFDIQVYLWMIWSIKDDDIILKWNISATGL